MTGALIGHIVSAILYGAAVIIGIITILTSDIYRNH